MKRLFAIFLIAYLQLWSPSQAKADFTMVNPLFRHSTSAGSAGVIVIPEGNKHQVAGLFFYYSKTVLPAQGFSVEQLPSDTESIFLSFDTHVSRKFNSVTVSSGRQYSISGNVTFRLGTLRITIHDENQAEQYVSAVLRDEQGGVGFVGLQLVVSPSSKSNLLKYMQPKGAEEIDTFEVKNGILHLNSKPYEDPKIGLGFGGGSNPCVSNGVQILTRAQYTSVIKGDKKLNTSRKNFYTKNTLLFSEPKQVIAMNGYGQLLVINPEAERLSDGSLICVADVIREDK